MSAKFPRGGGSRTFFSSKSNSIEFIFLNAPELLEHLAMLLTSTLTINCKFSYFLNKAFSIIGSHFFNSLRIL